MAIAIASAFAAVAVAGRVHQSFYSDAALQTKTVIQFVGGTSPRVNDWIRPDYADLSQDRDERLIVWALGTPVVFLPLVRAGLTPASAARAVAALAIIAGAAGWTWWFASFGLPRSLVFGFAGFVPWLRVASNALFLYGADVLVFAVVPWLLVAAVGADRRRGRSRWIAIAAVGFAAGVLYVVKYSAAFVTAAVLAWIAWRALTASDESFGTRVVRVVIASVAAAIPVLAVAALNRQGGGAANILTATGGGHWQWLYLLHAVTFPALTAADLDSLLTYVLMHPVHGLTHNTVWLTIAGLPGGILLAVLAVRARQCGAAPALARMLFIVGAAALLVVWTLTTAVSVEPRHVIAAGMAMLPLAIAEGLSWRANGTRLVRVMLAATALVFVAAPFGYGVVSVFAKATRYPADYRPATSGVFNPLLANHDAASVVRALSAGFDPAHDVWYVTDPVSTLDLPGRAIVRHADFLPLATLRRERFVASCRVRVHALLPARFEENGKGAAIRASFPQATHWVATAIPDAQVVSWTADLENER